MNVYLEVYGCTANKSDARIVKGIIDQHPSYQFVKGIEEADIFIILTCTVINTTEQRMISRIKQFQQNNKKLIIAGCMASGQKKLLKDLFPKAILVSPRDVHQIINRIEQRPNDEQSKKYDAPKRLNTIITPISIAEGCQYHCSYCITCKARGSLCSYPENFIYADVKTAITQESKEIQLTAQDTASYGKDKQTNLGELLEKLSTIKGRYQLRVGMMNPRSLQHNLPSILHAFSHPSVYKFLHLPVQSGSNTILKKMNRGYHVEDFQYLVNTFRNQFPDIVLSTDIIVGFPGETEDQFQSSIDLIESVKPDIINITRFSARPQTKAKTLKHRIPTEIVKMRSRTISRIAEQITTEKNNAYIGKTFTVLTTSKKTSGSVISRAQNYKPVVIKKDLLLGEFQQVNITDATSGYLIGTLK